MSCQEMTLRLRAKKSEMALLTRGILGCNTFARSIRRRWMKLSRYLIIE